MQAVEPDTRSAWQKFTDSLREKIATGVRPEVPVGWEGLVAPGPPVTGGLSSLPDHPSRKHDTTAQVTQVPADVVHAPFGAPRRRDRRAAGRASS